VTISPGDINPGPRVSDGFAPVQPVNFALANNPFGTVFAVDPHFRPSYAEQFNLTVEHEIAPWALMVKTASACTTRSNSPLINASAAA